MGISAMGIGQPSGPQLPVEAMLGMEEAVVAVPAAATGEASSTSPSSAFIDGRKSIRSASHSTSGGGGAVSSGRVPLSCSSFIWMRRH